MARGELFQPSTRTRTHGSKNRGRGRVQGTDATHVHKRGEPPSHAATLTFNFPQSWKNEKRFLIPEAAMLESDESNPVFLF